MTTQPISLQIVKPHALHIKWSDGQQRRYLASQLRAGCPCADCFVLRHNDVESSQSHPSTLNPEWESLRIEAMEAAGNYAYTVAFSDGHNTGIFSYELLRELGEDLTSKNAASEMPLLKQPVNRESGHVDKPDVILIGSGIMSATLGAMLKRLQPDLRIQLYEVNDEPAQESSHGWNNAGTGHAGICELSYTPDRKPDGSVDVTKAIEIFQQFEQSKQFWAYTIREGMIDGPRDFINQVPHISFVHGQEQVKFLKARYAGMSAHHFFREMEFSTAPEEIKHWAPLLIAGRTDMPVAATRMAAGTDIDFGTLARKLVSWLSQQPGCGVATGHRVIDLDRTPDGWDVAVKDVFGKRKFQNQAPFVFIGAGGGSLPLLQKSGIDEAKGYGGFPVGGQWLVCEKTEVVARHQAKVYGQAQAEAPTMAVPHLDTRVIDGKQSLLFGPFAAFTTKFLQRSGSRCDLPRTVRFSNIASLVKVGLNNLPLVKYLIQQGTQSMTARMKVLRGFYPNARREDWRLVNAGIRVQAIKKEDGAAGIVHYGTEVVTDAAKSISALLGASPGASVSVSVMLDVVKTCLPQLLESKEGANEMSRMIPTWDEDLTPASSAERFRRVSHDTDELLGLRETDQPRSNSPQHSSEGSGS